MTDMNTKSPQLEPGDVQPCSKADLVKAFDNYAKGFQDGYGEAIEKCTQAAQLFDGRAANAIRSLAIPSTEQPEIEKLRFQLVLAKCALEAIQRATINGDVCDDVAWFDQITTLHDFCDLTLSRLTDEKIT